MALLDGLSLRTIDDWLDRWETGRTGWHEAAGNAGLKSHWRARSGRVLVPLCGKSADLAWLAKRGHEVIGVELAKKAIEEFFSEQNLAYEVEQSGQLDRYRSTELPISVYCGDYFCFAMEPVDALYDRGAFVAIDPVLRERYTQHTRRMLKPGAALLLVTVEYDQRAASGPPFSIPADDMRRYWGELERVEARDDFENCPPKFREAGLTRFYEVVWRSPG